MGKVYLTENDRLDVQLRALLKKYQVLRGADSRKMAAGMGVTPPTFYRRLEKPSTMSLKELLSIQRRLQIPAEELVETIGRGRR